MDQTSSHQNCCFHFISNCISISPNRNLVRGAVIVWDVLGSWSRFSIESQLIHFVSHQTHSDWLKLNDSSSSSIHISSKPSFKLSLSIFELRNLRFLKSTVYVFQYTISDILVFHLIEQQLSLLESTTSITMFYSVRLNPTSYLYVESQFNH